MVDPYTRLTPERVKLIHETSLDILENVGIISSNRRVNELLAENGAEISAANGETTVRFPRKLVERCIEIAPSRVLLGARNPANRLILDAAEPRVRFGTGSEANVWLELDGGGSGKPASGGLSFIEERGSLERLCGSARLAEHLDSVDFFIRNVNIQDPDINDENKDVNVFFASLSNITKHVMAGITRVNRLTDVIRMAEILAGGTDAFARNPIISFITCVIKSPLQLVGETAEKLIAIAQHGIPVVISSSPQGGATGPMDEGDMVAMINAEILAGNTIAQLVRPGAPVLYGAVPARANMNTLHNMYGAPETNQYNVDCVQMAKFYKVPCYSTAGVSDAAVPGIQATVERMFSHLSVTLSGPQYLHYAFGLLDKTNVFSPAQAVLDDAHIAAIKHFCRAPAMSEASLRNGVNQLRQVMDSSHKLFARFARKGMRTGKVFRTYPFEADKNPDATLLKADERAKELMRTPAEPVPQDAVSEIYRTVPDVLPRLRTQTDT